MKKIIAVISSLIVAFSMLFLLGSCKNAPNFELNFIVDSEVYYTIKTNGNEVIKMPDDPVKDDYYFDGWYWDKNIWKKQFTARSLLDAPLSSNMNVYAHFIDDSYVKDTDLRIKEATKINIDGIGEVFYLKVRNNQLVCKLNDYVEVDPRSKWILSSDISGNQVISSKTVELTEGDNNLYYIYVTDKNDNHNTYFVLIHRNYIFNVSFNSNGGTTCKSISVEEGDLLENFPTSSKKGYTFKGWDYDFANTPINDNVTVNALWEANQYTITFDSDISDLAQSQMNVTYGEYFTLPIPKKYGYRFNGWYDQYNTQVTSGIWTRAFDVSLEAKWTLENYSINYVLNGGSFSSGIISYSIENLGKKTIDEYLSNHKPIRKGYTFECWCDDATLTTTYEPFETLTKVGERTLYAKWIPNKYTVTYDVNGGNPLIENTQQIVYDTYMSFVIPERVGYRFVGWYCDDILYTNGIWKTDADVNLIARWELINYAINYDLNGGINSPNNPLNYNYESNNIILSDPTRKGYTFIGWTFDSNNTPSKDVCIPQNSTGDKTFTANWQKNKYTISFDVNGGNVLQNATQVVEFDSEYTLPTASRTGYVFDGWYNNNVKYEGGIWKVAEDIDLIANWIPDTHTKYTVNYYLENANNNDYELDKTEVLYGVTDTSITPIVYVYDDFISPEEITDIIKADGSLVIDYYYSRRVYSLSFVTNGGNTISSIEQKYASNVETLTPTKDNRTFDGWYFDIDFNRPFDGKMPSLGDTLYAKWKEEVSPNELQYTYAEKITITGNYFSGSILILPDYIGGKLVTSIAPSAFEGLNEVTEVFIPDSVETIGLSSFKGLSSLERITIPFTGYSMTSTGTNAVFGYIFGSTNKSVSSSDTTSSGKGYTFQISNNGSSIGYYIPTTLRRVNITKQENVSANAFYNCDLIEEIFIPTSTLSIGSNSFYNCSSLKQLNSDITGKINIPANVKTISSSAFYNCSLISMVNLGDLVETIGAYAFYNCSSLVKVTLGNSIKAIQNNAFENCTAMEYFNSIIRYKLEMPNVCQTIGINAFSGMSLITEVVIPNSVKSINSGAFKGFDSLEEISLPFTGYSITSTGVNAVFGYIFGITSSNVLESDKTSLEKGYTFQIKNGSSNCACYIPSTLRKVNITKQESISDNAFYNCDLIEEVNIPSTTTAIGSYAFYGCSSITNVSFGETVETIESYAFYNCASITNVSLGDSVKTIESYAFYGCSSIEYFNSDTKNKMEIPNLCKTIGTYAFSNMSLITNVVLPDNVESIGEGAFKGFDALTEITLPFIGYNTSSTGRNSVFGYIFGVTTDNVSTGNKTSANKGNTYQIKVTSSYGYFIPNSLRKVNVLCQENIPANAFYNCD